MSPKEDWAWIPEYQGVYEISTEGRVRSYARGHSRIIKQFDHKQGYKMVQLHLNGQRVKKYIHSLMLESFVEPRPANMYGCHNDGNPANNSLQNLRWDTPSANQEDSIAHGTHAKASKIQCKRGHKFTIENTYIGHKANGRTFRQCRTCSRDSRRPAGVAA